MRISEIYCSRQGEGLLTGTASWFVRTSGCNLRCWFCDTPFTSWEPEGTALSIDEIARQLDRRQADHVVITGGEPMLPAALVPLTNRLHATGFHLTIETAGTIARPVHCDLMSISPKLSNSTPDRHRAGAWHQRHEQRRYRPDVIRQLTAEYPYQLKFVIDTPDDIEEVERYLEAFPEVDRGRVLLMPQGTELAELNDRQRWLEPECHTRGFIFCPRKHIQWYGHRRGT